MEQNADNQGEIRGGNRELLDLELLRNGQLLRRLSAEADPSNASELNALLADAIRRAGVPVEQIRDFEMNVRFHGERGLVTTFVASGV